MVPGSTLRYGSSFCMLTRRPRSFSRRPRLEAVSPLPRLEATPPVTKTCLVKTGRAERAGVAKSAPVVKCRRRCPPVHGVSEYQDTAFATCTDTGHHGMIPHRPPERYPFGPSTGRLLGALACPARGPGCPGAWSGPE